MFRFHDEAGRPASGREQEGNIHPGAGTQDGGSRAGAEILDPGGDIGN